MSGRVKEIVDEINSMFNPENFKMERPSLAELIDRHKKDLFELLKSMGLSPGDASKYSDTVRYDGRDEDGNQRLVYTIPLGLLPDDSKEAK